MTSREVVRFVTLYVSIAFLIAPAPVLACSCDTPKGVAAAYRDADAVFLAKVVSVSYAPTMYSTGDAGWARSTEEAELVVEKAWKSARVGDHVRFETPRPVFGACDRSLMEKPEGTSRKATGRWIIYVNGQQPYRLTVCDRSQPLTDPASPNDERTLDDLVRQK